MSINSDMLKQLAEVMLDWDGELRSEIRKHENELQKGVCAQPQVREAIELLGYDFLSETLKLDDETFAAVYQIKELSGGRREHLQEMIAEHTRTCRQCQLSADRSRWLDEKMSSFIKQEKQLFRELLTVDKKQISTEGTGSEKASGIFSSLTALFHGKIVGDSLLSSRTAMAAITLLAALLVGVYQWQDLSKAPTAIMLDKDRVTEVALLEAPDINSEMREIISKQTPSTGTLKSKKPQTRRLPASKKTSHELVAHAQEIHLDDYSNFRRTDESGSGGEKSIKITASRLHLTPIPLKLPERSEKGWYEIDILEAKRMSPVVRGRAKSRDGKTLMLRLDLREVADDEYYLSLTGKGRAPRFYLITISGAKSSKTQNCSLKSLSQPKQHTLTP